MSAVVKCPACEHEFIVDLGMRIGSTHRSMPAVNAPARDDAPTCAHCGLVRVLHEGADNLAATKGCEGFVP